VPEDLFGVCQVSNQSRLPCCTPGSSRSACRRNSVSARAWYAAGRGSVASAPVGCTDWQVARASRRSPRFCLGLPIFRGGTAGQASAVSSPRPSANSHQARGSQSPLTKPSTADPRPLIDTAVPGG
jgi:hypothetical protein